MALNKEQITEIKLAVRYYQQHLISVQSPRYEEYSAILDELSKLIIDTHK